MPNAHSSPPPEDLPFPEVSAASMAAVSALVGVPESELEDKLPSHSEVCLGHVKRYQSAILVDKPWLCPSPQTTKFFYWGVPIKFDRRQSRQMPTHVLVAYHPDRPEQYFLYCIHSYVLLGNFPAVTPYTDRMFYTPISVTHDAQITLSALPTLFLSFPYPMAKCLEPLLQWLYHKQGVILVQTLCNMAFSMVAPRSIPPIPSETLVLLGNKLDEEEYKGAKYNAFVHMWKYFPAVCSRELLSLSRGVMANAKHAQITDLELYSLFGGLEPTLVEVLTRDWPAMKKQL